MVEPYAIPCRPPLWARGGQAQTLLGFLLPSPGDVLEEDLLGVTRRELELADGDRIVTFDAEAVAPNFSSGAALRPRPLEGVVVHLFHGLTGSSESNYMRATGSVLRHAGARVIAFNHRGQGPGAGLARGFYHSGSDLDLFASVAAARELYPGAPHIAVGFSLSANTLLLGLHRRPSHRGAPDAVLAVNPPADLSAAVDRIDAGFNRLYDRRFVRGMREALRTRRENGWVTDGVEIPSGASVREADDAVTAPAAGYASADAYYADCSAAPRLAGIQQPVVILSSGDDPFIDPKDLTSRSHGPRMHCHIEPTGGHLGYLSKGIERAAVPEGGKGSRWLGGAVLHYVAALARQIQ